jgi:hypothetical protein
VVRNHGRSITITASAIRASQRGGSTIRFFVTESIARALIRREALRSTWPLCHVSDHDWVANLSFLVPVGRHLVNVEVMSVFSGAALARRSMRQSSAWNVALLKSESPDAPDRHCGVHGPRAADGRPGSPCWLLASGHVARPERVPSILQWVPDEVLAGSSSPVNRPTTPAAPGACRGPQCRDGTSAPLTSSEPVRVRAEVCASLAGTLDLSPRLASARRAGTVVFHSSLRTTSILRPPRTSRRP